MIVAVTDAPNPLISPLFHFSNLCTKLTNQKISFVLFSVLVDGKQVKARRAAGGADLSF